jgi:ubiquinone/menaquinone biosynthesis C-methylase UbiE
MSQTTPVDVDALREEVREKYREVGVAPNATYQFMTSEMLEKSRTTAKALGVAQVEFREGFLEAMPMDDGWAYDVYGYSFVARKPE